MSKVNSLVAQPSLVRREEFDEEAILYHGDRGKGFGINPTGVFI